MQQGRAWARLGDARQTRATLSRVEALVSPLSVPDRPEHHYRYDPPKAQFYVATTLSWLGDTAAEGITRQVLAAIQAPGLLAPVPARGPGPARPGPSAGTRRRCRRKRRVLPGSNGMLIPAG